jgi:cytidyltransferase-like protein
MTAIVAVSGGFDPPHVGHLRMFQEAAGYGRLVVIVNNDNWLRTKKGFVFMPEGERLEIVRGVSCVHEALLTKHALLRGDQSVCDELLQLRPTFFANGGDRQSFSTPENILCGQLGITMLWGIGGFDKVQSSSKLVENTRDYLKTMG